MIPTEASLPGTVPGGARCALHGERPAEFTCSRCGNFACGECRNPGENGAVFCKACSAHAYGAIPLEQIAELGLFKALWQTVIGVLFKPWDFFAQRSRGGSIAVPLLYGTLVHVPSTLVYAVINSISTEAQLAELRANPILRDNPFFDSEWFQIMMSPGGQVALSAISLCLYPLYLILFAGLEWLAMFAVGARDASYTDTLRSICYLQSTALMMLVLAPFSLLLAFVAPQSAGILLMPYLLYSVIWLVIALWKTARTDLWRPVVAQGLLFFTCCCLPWMALVVAAIAMVGAALPR